MRVSGCDFAILDVRISDGTSYPVADALHRLSIPFCFASGMSDEGYLGANTISKPFSQRDIQVEIDRHR